MTLSVTIICHFYECSVLSIIMLNDVMLSAVILNVVMLSVVAARSDIFLEPAVKVLQRFIAKEGGAEQKGGWGEG